jgi:hypothetical protein
LILTTPYWLFAASAILIPIAIHLWNKRQGKTVKVGSLRWLEASPSNRWSSIKLSNFWLLVLRCLILILLAVALAQPVWEHQTQKQKGAKAIVVGEELLYTSALNPIKPTIDSLLKRGYTLHTYTSDFEQITQEKWQQISTRTQDSLVSSNYNYWSLLPALAEKYKSAQDSVLLFTSDQQQYFAGSRPEALPQHIQWIPVATDKSITWLQAAVQTTPDSLLLILGSSSREGTSYSKYKTAASAQSIDLTGNQLQLARQGDSLDATISGNTSRVKVQTEPLQVAILTDETQQTEARYIRAAIQAISSYTGLPIQVTTDTTNADWVFWLRNQQLPETINQQVKRGLKVWVQQNQKPQTIKTSLTGAGGIPIKVHQVNQPISEQQNQLWTAENGETILCSQPVGQGKIYTFRSGFSPAWSELGQSAQLPELLLPLLLPPSSELTYDYRALDEQQLLPQSRATAVTEKARKNTQASLLKWFVLAAFVLFLIERIIANRRSKV